MPDPSTPDEPPAASSPSGDAAEDPSTAPGPEPEAPAARPSAGWRSWAVAGAAAGVVVVAGIFLTRGKGDDGTPVQASASQGQTSDGGGQGGLALAMRGAQGKITKIDGPTLTLSATDRDGATSTVTVTTDEDTTFTDVVDGTAADVHRGDHVLVLGAVADGKVTAQRLTDNGDQDLADGFQRRGTGNGGGDLAPPGGFSPPEGFIPPEGAGDGQALGGATFGTVTQVDGDEITVSTQGDQSVVVTVDGDTEITVTKDISLDDLETGDEVRAEGERDGDTVAADAIRRGEGGFFAGGPGGGFRRSGDGSGSSTASAS
jgi:hypothetical protein